AGIGVHNVDFVFNWIGGNARRIVACRKITDQPQLVEVDNADIVTATIADVSELAVWTLRLFAASGKTDQRDAEQRNERSHKLARAQRIRPGVVECWTARNGRRITVCLAGFSIQSPKHLVYLRSGASATSTEFHQLVNPAACIVHLLKLKRKWRTRTASRITSTDDDFITPSLGVKVFARSCVG